MFNFERQYVYFEVYLSYLGRPPPKSSELFARFAFLAYAHVEVEFRLPINYRRENSTLCGVSVVSDVFRYSQEDVHHVFAFGGAHAHHHD